MDLRFFTHKLLVRRTRHPIVQLVRYGLVLMVAAPIDLGGYILLLHNGLEPVLAAAISFSVSLVANYFLSIFWVFNADPEQKKRFSAPVFAMIGVIGLGLTSLIIWICTSGLGINEVVAKLIAFAIVFFWNFGARRYLFTPKKPQAV